MLNLIITDVKNETEELILIQKKLFENGVIWNGAGKNIKDKLNVFNDDEDLILIIKDNNLSWTNKGYGFDCSHSEIKNVSGKEFLKD